MKSFIAMVFFMAGSMFFSPTLVNAEDGCLDKGDFNNGKKVTVQTVCQCDETSHRQQCYQAPPTPL